ncbi:hypothetical protein [Bradyrhizobium pachyrhizi]|uniref:hypothetical protein n=1 Tax=Bradyrhizobium pachyrhizi TaxID=280333 RepID=UPI003D36ED8D
MGLANTAVVVNGRICKCIEVRQGFAVVAFIDHRDRIITREVPAAACMRFVDAMQPRSFWPDANLPFLEGEEPAFKAKRNRKRIARENRKTVNA